MPDRSPSRLPAASCPTSPRGAVRLQDLALGLSACGLAVAAAVAGHRIGDERALLALPGGFPLGDLDGDGLSDLQEQALASNPLLLDTDFDGLSDREELARGSDPTDPESLPSGDEHGVGLVGVASGPTLQLDLLVYVPGPASNVATVDAHFGVYFGGQWIELPVGVLLAYSSVEVVNSSTGGLVFSLKSPWNATTVANVGSLAFWAAVGALGEAPSGASVLQLTTSSGVLHSVQASPAGSSQGAGAAYRPIVPSEELPSNFTPGQMCVQELALAGAEGAVSVYEVQGADCQPADAYCSPGCAATAGSTVQVLDPLALLGG